MRLPVVTGGMAMPPRGGASLSVRHRKETGCAIDGEVMAEHRPITNKLGGAIEREAFSDVQ